MIFSNPPLVELITELRWVPGSPGSPEPKIDTQSGVLQFPLMSPHLDETFSRFANEVAALGFGNSERLIPVGFPYLPFSVVYRYRKPPAQGENYLYQIGPGVFSANALPPYRDWDSFRPIVQEGIKALLDSRHPSENGEFTKVTLRYINLFSEEFTEGRSSFQFMNDVLGIKLLLPETLAQQSQDFTKIQSGLSLSMPLKAGVAMSLNLAEGIAAGKSGIIMTTEVFSVHPVSPYVQQIAETLEKAHDSIRATFLGLTTNLRAKMGAIQ